jgi:hypothetical protein
MKTKIFLAFLIIVTFLCRISGQTYQKMPQKMIQQSETEDFDNYENPKVFKILLNENQRNTQIPIAVNNSNTLFFPWPFYQTALECGQSTSITQIFNYEICFQRGWTDINYNLDHKFPAYFVWNFCNDGINQGVLFLESWKVVESAGTCNITDWGGYPNGNQYRIWINGYDKYYRSMQNRISEVCAIPTDSEEGILTLKHWLYNHIEGKAVGGLANFNATYKFPDAVIPDGFPGAGKSIITKFNADPNHAYIILGYNDTIGWDFNQDNQITNDLDLNGDGQITVQDWEKGCFIISHTSGPGWGDFGQCFLPYRIMATGFHDDGVWGTTAYVVKVREKVRPQLTAKVSLTYNKRGRIKVYFGVSEDTTATTPTHLFQPFVFDYQGGDFYMTGDTSEEDKTLEFGIDITPLLNHISPSSPAKFFLMIDEKDPDNSGIGQINQFSLISYSDTDSLEINSQISNHPIVNQGTTSQSIVFNLHFSKPIILDSLLHFTVNKHFEHQMSAQDGIPNYRWEIAQGYEAQTIPNNPIQAYKNIPFSDLDTGCAEIDLPFTFPFYKENINKVYIFADGFIGFSVQDYFPFVYSNTIKFETVRMIAPFFADLEVINTKTKFQNNELIISYKGKVKNQPESYISFIVILKSDGTIEIHYGEMKYGKTSYISGISNGKNNNLIYSSLNNLPAALIQKKSVRFKPIDHLSHIALTSTGLLSGVSDTQKTDSVLISCFDNNEIKAQKWIYLDFTNPSYLTIKKISFAKSDCNKLQKGSEDFLNIEITNYGDSAYQNIHLSYQINSPFIISPAGNLHLGSFAPLETQNFTQLIHLESTGNAPDNNPIDLQWFLINNQDTISKGIFTFSIKTPEFEVQEYSLTQKQAVYNNYNLDIRLKNLNECNVSDLSFELSISDGSYSISPELNGVQKADQFETVHLLFNIVDQESMLYLSKIQFSIKIYSFGKLIQVENFDFIPNNQYTANPNPTFNYTEISASDPHQIITHAEIYHVSGIRVQSMEVSSTPFILDLSGLVQGVYYVKITSKDQKSSTLKIIKL